MNLTAALAMDITEIAQAVGVTARTAARWAAGTQRPNSRNRAILAGMVNRAHCEHSAASGERFSPVRDLILARTKLALMTAAERAATEAARERMRAQFALAV